MKFKKILITGSAGLLGRHVVRELMPHSHVIGFDLKKCDESIEQIVGSTTDFSAVLASCKDVDAVIHVAARPNIWSGTGEQILKDIAIKDQADRAQILKELQLQREREQINNNDVCNFIKNDNDLYLYQLLTCYSLQ